MWVYNTTWLMFAKPINRGYAIFSIMSMSISFVLWGTHAYRLFYVGLFGILAGYFATRFIVSLKLQHSFAAGGDIYA